MIKQLSLFSIKLRHMCDYGLHRVRVEKIGLSTSGNRTFIKFPDGSTRCVDSKDIHNEEIAEYTL